MLSFLITAATVTTSVVSSFAEGICLALSGYSIAKGMSNLKNNFTFKH